MGLDVAEASADHRIDVCACGNVVNRCRCPGPHQSRVVQDVCSSCEGTQPGVTHLALIPPEDDGYVTVYPFRIHRAKR